MNAQSETEQLQNFHQRLSQWVSSQGFWFQLRYSFSGKGTKGALTFHLLRLCARFAVFLLVAAAGVWVYLVKQADMSSYREEFQASLKEKLGAEQIEMRGLERRQGQFSISRLTMSGKESTFFSGLELRNLKCRKTLLDVFRKEWDPGVVTISRADLGLRAGSDSLEAAESIADVYFQDTEGIKLKAIVVNDLSVRWGYSARTRGSITGSDMRAERLPDGWRLRLKGGTFSQNWLKRLEIDEIDLFFGKKGIVFEKAQFRKGAGSVSFVDLKVKAGERPEISGAMRLRKIDVSSLLPMAVRNFVEGTLSAELKVFGSTNSTEGVGFEGNVALEGEDIIVIRDRVHLLRALSVIDVFNNYRRVDFRKGSFHMKTHGGRMEITDVNLAAGELFRMKGGLAVRLPTNEEALSFSENDSVSDQGGILNEDEIDFTLERAAEQAADSTRVGFGKAGDDSLYEKLGLSVETRRLEERASERLSRAYRYEGGLEISLPKEAFEKAPRLAEAYPKRDAGGRILMDVPLEGVLYELTLKQSDEVYQKGAR
jgi:hypothetical protein